VDEILRASFEKWNARAGASVSWGWATLR